MRDTMLRLRHRGESGGVAGLYHAILYHAMMNQVEGSDQEDLEQRASSPGG